MRVKRLMMLALLVVMTLVLSACNFGSSYSIQGKVTDEAGRGVKDVTVTFTGGTSGTTKTDADGNWTMNEVKGTVTVAAAKEGWSFSPASTEVSEEKKDVNFTGEAVSPEAGARRTVDLFSQGFVNEDAEALADLMDESYLIDSGMTREEVVLDFMDEFSGGIDYVAFDLAVQADSIFETDRATVKAELTITVSWDGQTISESGNICLELVNSETGWKIVDYYDYSPQEAEITSLVDQFLNAMIGEDMTVITSMLTSNLQQDQSLLAQVETAFTDLDFNSYTITYSNIWNYMGANYTDFELIMNITSVTGTSDEDVHLTLNFVEENGEWLIDYVSMWGPSFRFWVEY